MYQSQNSSQMKLYSRRPTSPNSYFSDSLVTSSMVSLRRVRIHSSASVFSPSRSISSMPKSSPIFIRLNLDAFHILLMKFHTDSTLASEYFRSCPGVDPVARKYLIASAPNLSMTSIGSTPLPSDFDILRFCSSRRSEE